MKSLEKGKVNPAEVKELFTVPVEFFLKNPPKVYEADIISDVENFPYEETGISPVTTGEKARTFCRYTIGKIK